MKVIKCKKCRFPFPETSEHQYTNACSHFFIQEQVWIKAQEGHLEGIINCPKCSIKVGTFNWAGLKCSCGVWVVPGFAIQKAKVDMH